MHELTSRASFSAIRPRELGLKSRGTPRSVKTSRQPFSVRLSPSVISWSEISRYAVFDAKSSRSAKMVSESTGVICGTRTTTHHKWCRVELEERPAR